MKKFDFDTLESWLSTPQANDKTQTKAVISNDLKVIDDGKLGRCLITEGEISKDKLIMNIPKIYLLNYLNVLKHISYWNTDVNTFLKERISNFSNKLFETAEDDITCIYSKLDVQELLKLSTHQILMLYLTLEKRRENESFWMPLLKCLPELSEYGAIPITWVIPEFNSGKKYEKIYNSLPKEILIHSDAQLKQFELDVSTIEQLLSKHGELEINKEEYLWSWLAVNTRSLYYQNPTYLPVFMGKGKDASNITMVPYVDFVNHKSEVSNAFAKQSKSGYEVFTTANLSQGEHIWFTYGPHNDDFLQCEYGFSSSKLENDEEDEEALTYTSFNKYNTVDISNILTRLLKNPKKQNVVEWLKQTGYYGDYTIGIDEVSFDFGNMNIASSPSHRTRIALAALLEDEKQFRFSDTAQAYQCPQKLEKFYQGYNNGEYYSTSEAVVLNKILKKIDCDIDNKLKDLSDIRKESEEVDEGIEMRIQVVEKLLWNRKFIILSLQ